MQENEKSSIGLPEEWILRAQSDLKSAEILHKENGPTDSLCFHCHQTVEKMLKGFLILERQKTPKIHDPIRLLNLCKEIDKSFERLIDQASFLNRYYIETRYPSEVAVYSKKQCKEALRNANESFQFIINKMGVSKKRK